MSLSGDWDGGCFSLRVSLGDVGAGGGVIGSLAFVVVEWVSELDVRSF
jgi:hypothetical protein